MATPSIRINQSGQPDGTPGVSRDNIVIGSELQVTDVANGGGAFSWTYVGPADSVAVPTGLGTNDVRLTPDVAGTYLFFLNHDSETDLSYTKNAIDEWYSSQGGAAVLLPDGRRLPTEGETDQFGGWEEAMQANAKQLIRLKEAGNVVTGGPFTELNFDAVGGGQVEITNDGSGTATVTISGSGTAASADALTTASGIVTVATSEPPSVGQALVATSPTEAVWQDVAAGAGANTSAQGDYIHATLSVDHVNPLNGEAIAFDTAQAQRGDLSVDSAGKFSGLKAGRTYSITGRLAVSDTAQGYITYQWYNVTDAASLPGTYGESLTTTYTGHLSSSALVTTVITPLVDTEIELRVASNVPAATARTFSVATITEIGAVQANVVGGLEFMDIIEVAADTTSVTFGIGGDGAIGRSLDGDIDEAYVIEFYIPAPLAGTPDYAVKPNNISTNQVSARRYHGTSASTANTTDVGWIFNRQAPNARHTSGTIEIQAKTGKPRAYQTDAVIGAIPEDINNVWTSGNAGWWNDTTTNITSIVIDSTVAATIKAGARFVLFRRTANNVRADSADTYTLTGSYVAEQGTVAESGAISLGRVTYGGSLMANAISLEEAPTGGSVIVRVKVEGVTKLTATLTSGNFTRALSSLGTIPVVSGDKITFTVESASYTNAAVLDSGVVVNVTLQNGSLTQAPVLTTSVPTGLSAPPDVAHLMDDEFEDTTLSGDWTVSPIVPVASAIDPYGAYTGTVGPRVEIHTDRRKSWLMCQPSASASTTKIHKAYTVPTNVFMWARMSFNSRSATTPVNQDFTCGIAFTQTSAGPDADESNRAALYLNESDGGKAQPQAVGTEGGVTEYNYDGFDNYVSLMQYSPIEYIAIHKVGSVFHYWVAPASGSWIHFGSYTTFGGTMDRVTITFQNASTASPGAPIMGIDFIRFVESATFLP
jgi:hypothetical protein